MQKEHDTVKFTNMDEYIARYAAMDDVEQAEAIGKELDRHVSVETDLDKETSNAISRGINRLFRVLEYSTYPPSARKEVRWPNEVRPAGERMLRKLQMYVEEFEQTPRCLLWVPG